MDHNRTEARRAGSERGTDAPAPDQDLRRLQDELRALFLILPALPVPPEADEALFDNMPV